MIIGVIGSVAQQAWMDIDHEPADLDIVATYEDIQALVAALKADGERVLAQYPIASGKKVVVRTDKRIIEAEVAWPGSSGEKLLELIQMQTGSVQVVAGVSLMAPPLDLLYMLKMSHRYLKNSPHFLKTMKDIKTMRAMGCKIRPEHEAFYKERMEWTYNYAHPKLNQSKGAFFDNEASIYTLDHDDIHLAVKHMGRPAYEYFKPDAAEVMCSKDLFFAVDEEVRLYAGLEEAYVLSLERSIHPFPNVDKKWAFDTALMKLATSISSGWFREYVWENYDEIQAMYNVEYVDRFYAALAAGEIKPFKEEK